MVLPTFRPVESLPFGRSQLSGRRAQSLYKTDFVTISLTSSHPFDDVSLCLFPREEAEGVETFGSG